MLKAGWALPGPAALLAHLMLAFPSGRLSGRAAVALAAAAYMVALPVRALWTLLSDQHVIKHAHAAQVVVRLARAGDTLAVEVADDGVGLGAAAGGSGLRGLADRVGALEGTLSCTSTDRGTIVRAEIPCAS